MIRVLIVEDEKPISELIRLSLSKAGYYCLCAYDGAEAANILEKELFDLVLLDVMLPGVSGFELLEYIQPTGTPVIFITAKNSLDDRVKGLRMGAEDYIVKPFEIMELLARVEVVLRRYQKTEEILQVGDLTIDLRSMQVQRGNETIFLTKKEWDLMLLFVQNPGAALYRETIYERVWGGEYPVGSRVVDLHIQRLRKKIGWEDTLRTVNRVGYRLEL
ncbi:MAG: response regulator transcription factor [Firmicutes bacterium]|nr:response regulator transcription factor [Oscillospiraceae bacterium]MBS5432287.1 response regulator transcription factor [Bacillota bacterium]